MKNKSLRKSLNHLVSVGPALELEKVIGATTTSNATFCANMSNGDMIYASGAIAVHYSARDNRQRNFFKSERAISCVCTSDDGRYLAMGERGHLPTVTVWDISSGEKLHTITGHKHGVGCVAFSPSGDHLVTVGFKHDKQLLLWDWANGKGEPVTKQKLGNKVNAVSFSHDGTYFVTAGDRHLKWWYMQMAAAGVVSELYGKPASILEEHKTSVFTDVVCSRPTDGRPASVYCTTTKGLLCVFQETRLMDRWLKLESPAAFGVSFSPVTPFSPSGVLAIACADGIVRLFEPESLTYITTLPLPEALGGATDENGGPMKYPAAYAVQILDAKMGSGAGPLVAVCYADRSLITWDVTDPKNVSKYRSSTAHRACIWDIHFLDSLGIHGDDGVQSDMRADGLPKDSFVTCGADNTIRFWNTDPRLQRRSKWRTNYSKDLLHCLHVRGKGNGVSEEGVDNDGSATDEGADTSVTDLSADVPDRELPDRPLGSNAPRALAVHPLCRQVACGDRQGILRVFDLKSMTQVKETRAHEAEILTLSYSPALHEATPGADGEAVWTSMDADQRQQDGLVMLASAGRDRLVHIFDASPSKTAKMYTPMDTLDNHSSSVTIVKFTADGKRLLSCGGDKTMVVSRVNGPSISRMRSIQTPSGTINGLAVDATNKFVITSGQEKRLNIWNIHSGRHMRTYRQKVGGELYKCDIDPSGMFVAACGFDKTIKILDFFSGEIVGEVGGHGELITGIKFSPDGRHLVTVAGDGCIFIWKVGDILYAAMQERLLELFATAQAKEEQQSQIATNVPVPADVPSIPVPEPMSVPVPDEPAALSNASAGAQADAVAAGGKWAANVREDRGGGYELFGRKVDAQGENRNKFTLELGSTHASDVSEAAVGQDSNKLARSLEAGDDVMLGDDDDFGGDASGTGDDDSFYGSDFEGGGIGDGTEDEAEVVDADTASAPGGDGGAVVRSSPQGESEREMVARKKLEAIERETLDIESWLDTQIREETKGVDEGKGSDDMPEYSHAPNLLARSLTSDFFNKLRKSREGKTLDADADVEVEAEAEISAPVSDVPGINAVADLPPPPPLDRAGNGAGVVDAKRPRGWSITGDKRRETQSLVAQMKERLKKMGILEQAGATSNGSETEDEAGGDDSDTDSDSGSVLERDEAGDGDFKPPVPPDFTDPERQIFGASGSKSFPVPDFKGLTGVQFPSEQTLLAGLKGDGAVPLLSTEETKSPNPSRAAAHGEVYELDNVETSPLPLPPPPASASASAEDSTPESATVAAATMPPTPPTLSTHEDQVDKELLAKAADCRKVMDQMIQLSLQATEMYSSLQAMRRTAGADASTDGSGTGPHASSDGFVSPEQSYDGLPTQSVFSPRGGRKTVADGSSAVSAATSVAQSQALTEVDKVLHDLRQSMASLSAVPRVPSTTPATESPPAAPHVAHVAPVAPAVPAVDEDAILAKYSDRLAEMVSEKVAAKMSASLSLTRSISATHASTATMSAGGAQEP